MKKFSLIKLAAALMICNVFIFSCAVTGTVSGGTVIPEDEVKPDNSELTVGGTLDFIGQDNTLNTDNGFGQNNEETGSIIIEGMGFTKPTLVNKTIYSSYLPTSSVKELTQSQQTSSTSSSTERDPDIDVPPESVPDPNDTSEPDSGPLPQPVESSSSDDNTEQPTPDNSDETEYPDETPAEPNGTPSVDPEIDPNSEIFRVNDGGTEVSGSAVDIVTKIVENEIGSTFAPEAIKAQAVTAYTYVKYHNLHGNAPYCILKESTNESVRTLVESVLGEAIYYEGELIQAVYSASSAGSSASSQNVWGGYIPYLQGVYCELDEKYDPNYGIKKTFSESEMKQRIFENAGISLSGDPSSWFVIENRTEGKYVGDMKIGGESYFIDKDGDTLKANGRRFREIIMEYDIRSSAFDIEYDADSQMFTITTYGYGHGVGLSQNGANNLAKYWGWDYKQILTFYFQGTEVY